MRCTTENVEAESTPRAKDGTASGIKFYVTQKPEVALVLLPWFVPVDQTREAMYLELRYRLTYHPDETFVCVALDGDTIKGMAIAYCRQHEVFVWQAAAANDVSSEVVDAALKGIVCWARSKGFSKIVAIPNRARELWVRRWGFQESRANEREVFLEI